MPLIVRFLQRPRCAGGGNNACRGSYSGYRKCRRAHGRAATGACSCTAPHAEDLEDDASKISLLANRRALRKRVQNLNGDGHDFDGADSSRSARGW